MSTTVRGLRSDHYRAIRTLPWLLCVALLHFVDHSACAFTVTAQTARFVEKGPITSFATTTGGRPWILTANRFNREDEPSEGDWGNDLLEQRMRKDRAVAEESNSEDNGTNMLGFTLSNFDESALPLPLFTGVIILLGSLYVTAYGFYVGLNGFPTDGAAETLPRIF